RQPLPRVEELEQDGRVGAESLEVRRLEEGGRGGGGDVRKRRPVHVRASELLVAANMRGRSDPVLGRVVVAERDAPEGGDPRAAAVEAMDLVGPELERLHALTRATPARTAARRRE